MKYYLTKTVTKEVDINFEDLYKSSSEENNTNDVDYIYGDILDNFSYYLRKVYNIEVEDEDELDVISDDFGNWMEKEKGL